MFGFLNIDSPFYKTLSKITNYAFLGLLWVLSCIPIVTVSAACAAAYGTHHKVIKNGNGYLWGTYWQQFRANFVQSTLLGFIMLIFLGIFVMDLYFLLLMGALSKPFILVVFLVLVALCLMWMQYWLPYIVHIDDPIGKVLKNTFIMCILHLPRSVWLLISALLSLAINISLPLSVILEFPPLAYSASITLILTPVLYSLLTHRTFVRVFSNYWDMTDGNEEFLEKQLEKE